MNKVLIIGSNYFNFNESVQRAFEALGWQCFVEGYDNPVHPFKGWMKWKHKFSCNKERLREKQSQKYNGYIRQVFEKIQPDLVFVLNGSILFVETLDKFRQTAKVVVWMYDTLARYPKSKEHINHSDAFFCYEKQDTEAYLKQGKTAYFLPQACDEKLYYPSGEKKDIDILFVGTLYRYEKRIQLLKAVVRHFPDKRILIIGVYKPWYKNPFKWLFREKKAVYTNNNIPFQEVNNYYNRAKIVLNIHHETQQDGANPKVFEIAGAGAYQLCDANPYIEKLFPDGEIGLYRSKKELLDLIDNALQQDKSGHARRARQIVLSSHTFTDRIKEVLKIIKNR